MTTPGKHSFHDTGGGAGLHASPNATSGVIDQDSTPALPANLTLQLGVATGTRIVLNTARRMVYAFAPAFGRALGVPLTSITSLIAINQATGVLSIFFGPLGDRWGYRTMMLVGLGLLSAGMLMAGFWPIYLVMLVTLILAGIAKSMFDPALQAYVGKQVPYQQRGRAIGLIELSWSASTLIGIPLVGLLMDRLGWRSPFFVLGGLGLLCLIVIRLVIPRDKPSESIQGTPINFGLAWQQISSSKAAVAALLFSFFTGAANDSLFVVYAVWMESSFGLTILTLGAATVVIGTAELLGEGLTATLSDRIGLKRALVIGVTLSTLSYLVLPILGQSLPLALAGLFFAFVAFEFMIVTAFSLFTEILPQARATMMSSNTAALSIGRVVGALIGGAVWLAGGLPAIGLITGIISGLALASLWWGLRDWQR